MLMHNSLPLSNSIAGQFRAMLEYFTECYRLGPAKGDLTGVPDHTLDEYEQLLAQVHQLERLLQRSASRLRQKRAVAMRGWAQ
jgi:hypothetical protein